MNSPTQHAVEPDSDRAEETATSNLGAEIETVRPDPYHRPPVEPAPRMSEHYENQHGNHPGAALLPAQVKRLNNWRPSRRNAIKRLWFGKGGRKLAIHMQCLDCCGEEVEAVRTCADRCCPLWRFRPFQQRDAQ